MVHEKVNITTKHQVNNNFVNLLIRILINSKRLHQVILFIKHDCSLDNIGYLFVFGQIKNRSLNYTLKRQYTIAGKQVIRRNPSNYRIQVHVHQ
jgi:hypothetical protein